MSRSIRLLAMIAVLLALVAPAVSAQEPCRFVLGFAALREAVGAAKVGDCLENERFNDSNGNAEQATKGGLLVWRKADNFTAFTDGGTSWIAGPNGVQSRPNSERFSWERDPVQAGSPVPAPSAPAARPATAPPPPAAAPQGMAGMVLKLSDLPPGFTVAPDRTGETSNERIANGSADPQKRRARLAELKRTGGYIASFERANLGALVSGALYVQSWVSAFESEDGARGYIADIRASEQARGQPFSAPKLGDESYAFRVDIKAGQADNASPIDLSAYRLTFRAGKIAGGVDYAGSTTGGSPEEAVALAQIVVGRASQR